MDSPLPSSRAPSRFGASRGSRFRTSSRGCSSTSSCIVRIPFAGESHTTVADDAASLPTITSTPIAAPADPANLPKRTPRKVDDDVLAAIMPGPGREKLARGPVLVVTTGQQPGLFTGPLFTIYKALTAIALARRLESVYRTPVVPVFWIAGDDHDF